MKMVSTAEISRDPKHPADGEGAELVGILKRRRCGGPGVVNR